MEAVSYSKLATIVINVKLADNMFYSFSLQMSPMETFKLYEQSTES